MGPKVIEPPEECRTNHDVICALAERLGAEHRGFGMSPWEIVDETLKSSGWPDAETVKRERWIDCQPDFETAHYLHGFGHADGKFHFKVDWSELKPHGFGPNGGTSELPVLPDHWTSIEETTDELPFRLVTAPARNYLNSSFTETPTSIKREQRPTVMLHPDDAAALGVGDGARVRMGSKRGDIVIHTQIFDGVQRGVVIVESIWPNHAFEEGIGINALTGADPAAPVGGAAYHDNAVWIKAL